jgi:hypothetical protein
LVFCYFYEGIEKQNFDFVRYGSLDNKKRVHDEEFYQLFKQAADLLHIKPHIILDAEGNKFKIVGCFDQKVHTKHNHNHTIFLFFQLSVMSS